MLDCLFLLHASYSFLFYIVWGMISAISDNNTHALLRSSIGQYVISLPPRLVVASLYLFMIWLALFFINIVAGPLRVVLALIILSLFFQVVVPLSAFGRLIIHTGSMAKRKVLEEEFEKELLPSGLHAALLIRAHDRRRKYTSAIYQYQKKSKIPRSSAESEYSKNKNGSDNNIGGNKDADRNGNADHPFSNKQDKQPGRLNSFDEGQILATARLFGSRPRDPSIASASPSPQEPQPRAKGYHKRQTSGDSTGSNDLLFPRASFLNTSGSFDLKSIVKNTLSVAKGDDPSDAYLNDDSPLNDDSGAPHAKGVFWEDESSPPMSEVPPTTISFNKSDLVEEPSPLITLGRKKMLPPSGPPTRAPPLAPPPNAGKRTSSAQHIAAGRRQSALLGRRAGSRQLINEWEEEEAVRNLYDLPPPAELLPVDEEEAAKESTKAQRRRMPRPSLMNRVRNLASLRTLVSQQSIDSPDSSVGDDECVEEHDRLLGRSEEGSNGRPLDIESRVASDRSGLLPSGRSSGTRDFYLDGRNSDRG
jgi:hypothetical protein